MKHVFFIIIIYTLVKSLTGCSNQTLFDSISFLNTTEIYEPVFINFEVLDTFLNPFDQKEVTIDLEVISPDSEIFILPCFFTQNKQEQNMWQARLNPTQVGDYNFKIRIEKNNKTYYSDTKKLISMPKSNNSQRKGILTLDNSNPLYLRYDNGENFKGLGLNVGWVFEPKWNNPDKYTFELFFKELSQNDANFIRMWICPWNMPIEWTPVNDYEMFFENFENLNSIIEHTEGISLNEGISTETQSDLGQLLKTSSKDEYIVYKVSSPKLFKLMLYYDGKISNDDFELSYSIDNINYTPVKTDFSDSWNSYKDWKRAFLFSYELENKEVEFVKLTLRKSLAPNQIRLAGIQLLHGEPISTLDCNGLNQYSYNNSEKLDNLIKIAEKYGIKILVTLGYHGVFNPIMDSWGSNDEWLRNPYNVKNGGPCENSADFFINPRAKAAYKNYLRYFVARWGYSDVVAGWEFWNEIDLAQKSQEIPVEDIISWHAEMGEYLKSIDPYNHIVTTSLTGDKLESIWELKSIDITQIHQYRHTINFDKNTNSMVERFNKPHLIGEYAIDWKGPGFGHTEKEYEEEFHDGMWRGLFTESPILPLSWWWEFHLEKDHFKYFRPLNLAINELMNIPEPVSVIEIPQKADFQILGIGSSDNLMVWLKKTNTENFEKEFVADLGINGNFKVYTLNTCSGISSEEETLLINDGKIRINTNHMGSFNDLLAIIKRH